MILFKQQIQAESMGNGRSFVAQHPTRHGPNGDDMWGGGVKKKHAQENKRKTKKKKKNREKTSETTVVGLVYRRNRFACRTVGVGRAGECLLGRSPAALVRGPVGFG